MKAVLMDNEQIVEVWTIPESPIGNVLYRPAPDDTPSSLMSEAPSRPFEIERYDLTSWDFQRGLAIYVRSR